MRIKGYEIEKEYQPPEDGEEEKGYIRLIVLKDNEEYGIRFEYVKRGTAPSEHTPFPTASDREIYAWPDEEIPNEFLVTAGTDEALEIIFGEPPDVNLLETEYRNADGARNPFVKDPE